MAEDIEFNRKWHLASANRVSSDGTTYQRQGESLMTGNAGAWYETAVYWRNKYESLQATVTDHSNALDSENRRIMRFTPKEWDLIKGTKP